MDDMQTYRPTRRYVLVAWLVAVVVGIALGTVLALLVRDVWLGLGVGVEITALIGFSSVSAARRASRGTIEAAAPWTGDAGVRHHSGGAL